MFLKPFKVKSNSKVKSSERKKFVEQFRKDFALSDEEIGITVGKSEVCKQKLLTHNDDHVFVYTCDQQPVVIEIYGIRIPTVYTLWKLPQLLPTFTTHDPVLKRLQNGADLMLPGVVPREAPGLRMYGSLTKGQACAVNTTSNRAPIAVGYTAMSCDDMYMSAGRGKAVIISHVVGDELWSSGDRSPPPILLWQRPVEVEEEEEEGEEENDEDDKEEEDEGKIEAETEEASPPGAEASVEVGTCGDDGETKEEEEREEQEEAAVMLPDELLMDCFLHALRLSVKDKHLPLHANVLYGKHVLAFVPPGQHLDIRKTTFKKFSAFLNYMSEEGLITLRSEKDGVQLLEEVKRGHERLARIRVHLKLPVQEPVEETSKSGRPAYVAPHIEEVWFVVDRVLPFFQLHGHQKGEAVSSVEVKHLLTGYVKEKNLHDADDRSFVVLDPLLTRVLFRDAANPPERMPWRDLSVRLLAQMTEGHCMTFPGEEPLFKKKVKVPKIFMTVESRGGKKQVTLIGGAENFRVDLGELARMIQHGRACSATVTEDKRGQVVVQAQGDQRSFVGKLLTETYQLPKKYIDGYEEATKKKKKKR